MGFEGTGAVLVVRGTGAVRCLRREDCWEACSVVVPSALLLLEMRCL